MVGNAWQLSGNQQRRNVCSKRGSQRGRSCEERESVAKVCACVRVCLPMLVRVCRSKGNLRLWSSLPLGLTQGLSTAVS